MSETLIIDDALFARMERASKTVEERWRCASEALIQANVANATIGGLAVALWVRTANAGADRGTPNVDLMVGTSDVDRAAEALSRAFAHREGCGFGERPEILPRSAVRVWSLRDTHFEPEALSRTAIIEGFPTVALDDLVRAKLPH